MNIENERSFSNRDFVTMVRNELAAAGRPDVTIERSWIQEDTLTGPFLLHVPVGTELTVPIRAEEGMFESRSSEHCKRCAREFAMALMNLRSAEAALLKYVRDVRRAANAAVAVARSDGLDVLLDRVAFKPTHCFHLAQTSWKHAASHVLAVVAIRHLSFYLRPGSSEICVEEPADFAAEFEILLDEQRERQGRVAEMEADGCDLLVDGITLDLLAAHGVDAADTLRRVSKEQAVSLTVQHEGAEMPLSVITSDGRVTASIRLPQAIWNGEHLWFLGDEQEKDHKDLVGKSLGRLVPHPAFIGRPIASVVRRTVDHISFDLSHKYMFDAETGRIWRARERAAA